VSMTATGYLAGFVGNRSTVADLGNGRVITVHVASVSGSPAAWQPALLEMRLR
jgi:hypothetical protein